MMGKIHMLAFVFALFATALFAVNTSSEGTVPGAISCTISPSQVLTPVATTVQLSVSCQSANGTTVACPQMSWSSTIGSFDANTNPVTFNSGTVAISGTITAISSSATDPSFSCSIPATVSPGSPSSLNVSPKTASLSTGATQQFSALLYDQYGNQITSVQEAKQIVWSASENIGKVSTSGLFSAISVGKGTVSAVYESAGGTRISGTAEVSVTAASGKYCVLSPQNSNLTVMQTIQVSAKCYLSPGPEASASAVPQEVACPSVIWSATDGSIAPSVLGEDQTAVFTAAKIAKQVTITASEDSPLTCPGCTMSCSAIVNVVADAPTSISVSPSSVSLYIGGTQIFAASANDQFGNTVQGATFAWSSAGGVGSVDASGKFTASSTGSGTVKASLINPNSNSAASVDTLSATAGVSVSQSPSGGGSGGSGGSGSGGGSFASYSMVSFTCAGKPATVLTRIFRPNATALVEIFYMETTPSTKVFSSNVTNNQNASFTPANTGDYSLHVTVSTDQRNADFYVPQCTPSNVNVTKNVTIELAPPITPKNQTIPKGQTGQNEVPIGSAPQQEGTIFGLPLAWVLVAVGVLLIVAAYFLIAGKKVE